MLESTRINMDCVTKVAPMVEFGYSGYVNDGQSIGMACILIGGKH